MRPYHTFCFWGAYCPLRLICTASVSLPGMLPWSTSYTLASSWHIPNHGVEATQPPSSSPGHANKNLQNLMRVGLWMYPQGCSKVAMLPHLQQLAHIEWKQVGWAYFTVAQPACVVTIRLWCWQVLARVVGSLYSVWKQCALIHQWELRILGSPNHKLGPAEIWKCLVTEDIQNEAGQCPGKCPLITNSGQGRETN